MCGEEGRSREEGGGGKTAPGVVTEERGDEVVPCEETRCSRHLHRGFCRRMCRDAPVAGGRGKERVKTRGRTAFAVDARHPVVLWQGAEPFCCHHHLTADLFYPQSRKQRSQDASRTLGVAAGCAVALLVAVVCLSSGEGTDGYRTATLKHSPQSNRYSLSHTHTCVLLFIHLSREAAAVAVLDQRGDASEHRKATARMAMS